MNLGKKVISLLMVLVLLVGLLPYTALPQVKAAGNDGTSTQAGQREIDQSTYASLGLTLDAEDKGNSLTAPYSTEHTSQAFTASEVYVAASGSQGDRYLIRDGFDKMETNNRDSAVYDGNDKSNVKGNLDGAYIRYGVSSYGLPSSKGNTYASKLSSNSANVTDYAKNDFSGIYATSTAYNGGDGRDNYIAELRAYGRGMKTNGKDGGFTVQLFQVDANGKRKDAGTLSPTVNNNMIYGGGMAYFTRRYVQEMDAIMDIAAADVDGDGTDELFVYAGRWADESGSRYAYVDVFKGAEKTGELKISAGKASAYQSGDGWQWQIERIPVVTLAGGDLDRDGKEEIAVVASAPTDNSDVASAAYMTVFTAKSGSLKPVSGLNEVSLDSGSKAMVSANCAFGTFQLPSTSITGTVLLVAGYQSNDRTSEDSSGAYNTAAYRFAYYDPQTERFKLSDYRTQDLGDSGKKIAQSYGLGNGAYRPVHAPIALGCADMEGVGAENNNDEVLLGGEIYDFDTTGGITEELSSVSVCTSQVNANGNNKEKEQVWISDVQAGVVDTNPSGQSAVRAENKWRESFVYVVGVHRKEPVNGSDDYYWMDLGAAYLTGDKNTAINSGTNDKKNIFYSTQEGVIAESNRRNDDKGTFISLALPDFDNDSVAMRYVADYTVYTNPEVYAVLQASPYFADLNEVYDYIGNGGTSYGTSTSTGDTKTASFSQAVGVYHSLEVQAFAGGEYEVELSASYSYDYAQSTEVEHSVTYNAQAGGGDMVVVYTVPYQYYVYEMYDPDSKQWGTTILPAALDPVTATLDVEKYDEIAAQTEGMEPIAGNLLYSTPGEPETYVNQPAGTREFTFEGSYAHVGASSTTADITQEITKTTGTEHSHQFNLELNYKVGGGGALLGNKGYVGVTGSTGAGGGWARSSATGTAFSGTVDTLPAEATQYGFDWKLIVNNAKLGETPVWIVGYEVNGVQQPPRMPQNLTITEVGKDTIDLEWEPSSGAAYYEISMIDQRGEYNKIATVPYTITQYQVTDLDPNTAYQFSVRAVSATKGSSIDSPIAYATTLSGSANFEITEHPADATTAAGKTATFTAAATYTDANGEKPVSYQWQVKSTDSKADWATLKNSATVSGADSASLTVTASKAMDGYAYRCRLYYMNRSLYTKSAALEVSRIPTRIRINPESGVLRSSGTITTTEEKTVTGQKAVVVTKDGKTCSLMAYIDVFDGDNVFLWFDGEKYYAFNGDIPTLTDGLIAKDVTFTDANISDNEFTIAEENFKAAISTANADGTTTATEISLDTPTTDDTTISYNGDTYTASRKWVSTGTSYDKYTFYEAKNGEVTEYLYNTTDDTTYRPFTLSCTRVLISSSGRTFGEAAFHAVYQATETTVTETKTDKVSSDAYTLGASIWDGRNTFKNILPTGLTGTITFIISGEGIEGETFTVNLTKESENEINCQTQWTPKGEGAATITAIYSGDDTYAPSTATVNVYFVLNKEGRSALSLTAPATVTYGETANIAATLIEQKDSGEGRGTSTNVTEDATYTIEMLVNGKYEDVTHSTADYDYVSNTNGGKDLRFKQVTNYRITATYTDSSGAKLTDSKVIVVNKGTATLSAADTAHYMNDSARAPAAADLTGLANWDRASLNAGTDYTLTTAGETATEPGEYPIYIALKDSTAVEALQEKYNILLKNATYTLNAVSYEVTATGDANGSVSITYQAGENSVTLPVTSGTALPAGSKVTFTAHPRTGYTVSKWTVNGSDVSNNSEVYTIDLLNEKTTVSATFTPGTSTLTYASDNVAQGTVTANYLSGGDLGTVFTSGGNVNYNQSIRVTAAPAEGYVVDHWTVNGETLKAADGANAFTGTTYDFSKFTGNTEVKVFFAPDSQPTVTIKLVDKNGEPLPAAKVSVGGTELTGNNGVFTYTGHTGENPVITMTPPDGLLVDSWTATTGTVGTLSSDKRVMTLRDLRDDMEFTVKCNALNSYKVSFAGQMADGTSFMQAGTVSAVKVGTSDTLTSGGSQLQGSTILFTAEATEGYEIVGWTLNGKAVTPTVDSNTQTYRIAQLSENADLMVTFRKLLEVQLAMDSNGTLTCDGHTSDFYLPYGSKDALTFTAEPKEGYRVASWTMNGKVVTGQVVTNSDSQTYTYTPDQTNGLTADIVVSVTFEEIPTATVNFSVIDAGEGAHGTLSATATRHGANTYLTTGGTALSGSTVKFTATPDNDYKVFKWFLNGEEQTTAPELDITDTSTSYDVKAQFTKQSSTIHYDITSDSDAGHGASLEVTFYRNGMSQPDPIANNTSVTESGTLTAKVEGLQEGYEIAGWTLNGTPYTGDTLTCEVSATQGADIAVKLIRKSYTVKFSAETGGSVSNDKSIASGDAVKGDTKVTFTASEPQSGYTFAGWKVNGTMQETDTMTYELTVTEDTEIVACYKLADAEYTVAYQIVGEANGTVNVSVNGKPLAEDGKVQAGSEVVFTATPNADYMVENWFADEACTNPIGTAESKTYTIPQLAGNATVYVRFTNIPSHYLYVQSTGGGLIEVSEDDSRSITIGTGTLFIPHHATVLLTAKPSGSAYLQSWTLDGKEMPVNETLTLTLDDVTDDHTITAMFGATQMVNLKTTCGAGGTLITKRANGTTIDASKGLEVPKGGKITFTATPEADKMVKAWTVNGKVQDELSNTFTLVPTENAEVQVEFEDLKLFDLPTNASNYSFQTISRTPSDFGNDRQIRKNGTIEFKMIPAEDWAIRSLDFDGGTVTRCELQQDGSWIIRIENVVGNDRGGIGFNGDIYAVSIPLTINTPTNGTITVKAGKTELASGAMMSTSETFTITATPNSGYTLDKLTVTGATEQPDGTYWINNDAAEVTISASFKSTNNVSPGGGGGGGGGAVSTYTLTFDTNGGSAIDKLTKDSGTSIDLTAYKPTRDGYTFAGWYSDKDLTKAVTSVKLTANATVYAKWTQDGGTTKNPFVDVKEGAYYYDAVLWAVDQKITSGTSAMTFSPDASCTRAQMVTFLWRAAGSPKAENTKNPFTDVKADAYYYDAVLWAAEKGVTSGTSATTFSPDATVTRGQTVTFLYRNAGSPDVTGTMPFTDVESDAYYAKAVLWAVQQKITTGTSETTFSPANDCTRGQIVTFLYRAQNDSTEK